MRLLLLPFCFLLSVSSVTKAQSVSGQVLDSISGMPVDRGFIVLIDDLGEERGRVLTSTAGRYVIQVPGPGVYRIRSERIGFRVWESSPLVLNQSNALELNPRVSQIPRTLATINVASETACEERKGPDTGLLWEEARKALVAASWSAEQELYVHRLYEFDRVLDDSRRPIDEELRVVLASTQLPFVSADPSLLAERGYVLWEEEDGVGEWVWWGPDANVFLDPSFHETHCFWAVAGEGDRTGLVGLSFEPVPDRTQPDVRGTLWLNGETAELQLIEFNYQNVPNDVISGQLGGRAEFTALPSGGWILDRWQIRIPRVRPSFGRRPRIIGYRDAGGAVIESFDPEGGRVYESPDLVVIQGTVFDSTTGGPLARERLLIEGTEYEAEADENGMFEMRVLLNGEYAVTSTRMEWLGAVDRRFQHRFSPGDTVHVDLVIPSLRSIHRSLCRGAPPDSNRAVHGVFRTPGGDAVAKARVTATWEPGIRRRDETDSHGRYVLCDLPAGVPITVTVDHDDLAFDPMTLQFVERDLMIGSGPDANSFYVPDRIARLILESRPPGS